MVAVNHGCVFPCFAWLSMLPTHESPIACRVVVLVNDLFEWKESITGDCNCCHIFDPQYDVTFQAHYLTNLELLAREA